MKDEIAYAGDDRMSLDEFEREFVSVEEVRDLYQQALRHGCPPDFAAMAANEATSALVMREVLRLAPGAQAIALAEAGAVVPDFSATVVGGE